MNRVPLRLFLFAFVVAVAFACTEVGTSPNVAVALAFDTLPSPSVVYGDTLRDIDGVAAPLTAHAYNADGNKIPNAPIKYSVLNADQTVATIDPVTKFLVATTDTTDSTITLHAEIGGIPGAAPRTLAIVPAPDSVDRGASTTSNPDPRSRVDTIRYSATDTTVKVSPALPLRVLNAPNPAKRDSAPHGVRSYLVRYSIVSPAAPDTSLYLVNDLQRRSTIDTTGTDGFASRRIRLRVNRSGGDPDSVIVEGTAHYRGVTLPGAPIRYVIILEKAP
jgi:hypothetical protein